MKVMSKWIFVEADTNDGDYIGEINPISDEHLEIIKPLIQKIKEFKPYQGKNGKYWKHTSNFPVGDCLRKDLGELPPEELYPDCKEALNVFYDYHPHGEYGIHTITNILLFDSEPTKLL